MDELEILYDDGTLLAVNKPAGLPVHVTADPRRPHVQGLLEAQKGKKLVLFHRLDVGTSGVLLFGQDQSANKAMTDAFRDRELEKIYRLAVHGKWSPTCVRVETYIRKITGGRWINRAKGGPSERAVTHFRLLKIEKEKSYLEARLETGRTHQIRLHAAHVGHPVVGDSLYSQSLERRMQGRQISPQAMNLHAFTLRFKHPLSQKEVYIEAPLPSWFLT